jgi:hypothetical protein
VDLTPVNQRGQTAENKSAAFVTANADKIAAWYNKTIAGNDYVKSYTSGLKYTHVSGDKFKLSGKVDSNWVDDEMLLQEHQRYLNLDGVDHLVKGFQVKAVRAARARSASPSPKAKAASPKGKALESVSVTFQARLKEIVKDGSMYKTVEKPEAFVVANADKVAAWYNKTIAGNHYVKSFSSGLKYKHVSGAVFKVTGKVDRTWVDDEMLLTDTQRFLVIDGAEYEVHGYKVKAVRAARSASPKAKAASPKGKALKSVSLTFQARLKEIVKDGSMYKTVEKPEAFVAANADKVAVWYNQTIAGNHYVKSFSSGLTYKHVSGAVFKVTGKVDRTWVDDEMLLTDTQRFLVIDGAEYEVHGYKVKAGRAARSASPKAKAASPKGKALKSVSLTFQARLFELPSGNTPLFGANATAKPSAFVAANADKVAAWYNKTIAGNDYVKSFSSGLTYKHVSGDKFKVSGKVDRSWLDNETLLTDYQHPLVIDGAEHEVQGSKVQQSQQKA